MAAGITPPGSFLDPPSYTTAYGAETLVEKCPKRGESFSSPSSCVCLILTNPFEITLKTKYDTITIPAATA
ncbi:hypothetical protein N7453_010052 [Penicillium expansum]|nr:hypothetical protein N7453_010052 [Penicillium expansum]